MPRLYSDNAALTKVKAMYGKRLRGEDYAQLLQKKSVGEVAAYLKAHPGYREPLREVREELIHRGQLENLIRRRKPDVYRSLLRYLRPEDPLLRVVLHRTEVDQLLVLLRLLGAGAMDRYVTQFPAYLSGRLRTDLFALAGCRSYDEVLEALRNTPYFELLGPFRPVGGEPIDLPGTEQALLNDYYRRANELVRAGYSRSTAEDLEALLSIQAELYNLSVIYRLKRFYHAHAAVIARLLVEGKPRIGRGGYRPLLAAEDHRAVLERMAVLREIRPLLTGSDPSLELALRSYRRTVGRRRLRTTTSPPVAVLSYLILLDLETDNLIRIIEGARYGLPAAETARLLVY